MPQTASAKIINVLVVGTRILLIADSSDTVLVITVAAQHSTSATVVLDSKLLSTVHRRKLRVPPQNASPYAEPDISALLRSFAHTVS
jgi:hypothetical protein